MPAQFTLPPDTRATGTGSPAADMDAVIDALTASGAGLNVLNAAFAGGADPAGVSDSCAAFQACMNAATAAGTTLPGEMIIPPGAYKLNAATLHFTGPLKIRGLGTATVAGTNTGTALLPGVTLNCNGGGTGTHHMFDFPFQGYLWGGLEMSGVAINYTGTGNVFDTININGAVFRDMSTTLTSGAAMAMFTAGNNSCINMTHERCYFTTTAAVRTNPVISLSSSIPQGVSESTWLRCGWTNSGLDNTQYMVYYAVTSAGNGYHAADNFIDCFFEHPFGGCLKSLSGQSIKVDGCTVWDIFPALGQSVGNSMFYFGAYPGNNGSHGVRITGCERSLNATNLDGVHTWDVECESTTSQVYIEGFTTNPASASTQTNLFFNFHGCNDVTLVGNVSPRGAGVNGNSQVVITNPSPTQASISAGTIAGSIAGNSWLPADMGYITWAYDPAPVPFTPRLPAFGVLTLIGVWIRAGSATAATIALDLATLGSGLTAGQNLTGLYSGTGALLGFSADQTATWNTGGSTGYKTAALTQQSAGSLTNLAGLCWVAVLVNGSTTAPAFGAGNNISGTLANGPVSVATARYVTNGSALTALPASITPSANVLAQQTFWAAVS
jgi:hypothetical protein